MDEKQKKTLQDNLQRTRTGTNASRYSHKGLTSQSSKINGKGFRRLLSGRGVDATGTKNAWDSFQHSRSTPVTTRHAKKGERFLLATNRKHGRKATGNYVSKQSLGKTPDARIDKGALPTTNSATVEKRIKLGKDQNVVEGTIAPQNGWKDKKNRFRRGGGKQALTDGGYRTGAVVNQRLRSAANSVQQKSAPCSTFRSQELHKKTNALRAAANNMQKSGAGARQTQSVSTNTSKGKSQKCSQSK